MPAAWFADQPQITSQQTIVLHHPILLESEAVLEHLAMGITKVINSETKSSIWKVATENAERIRKPIFDHFPGYHDRRARPCSVIVGRYDDKDYKLIYNYDAQYTGKPRKEAFRKEGLKINLNPWELYCLSAELAETTNLIGRLDQYNAISQPEWPLNLSPGSTSQLQDWNPKKLIVRSTKEPLAFPQPEFK